MLEMNYSEQQLSTAVTSQGLRPVLASGAFSSLIERCWHGDPASRPSFDEVVNHLNEITLSLPSYPSITPEDASFVSTNTNEEVLSYSQQKRTDVSWASRAVQGLGSSEESVSRWVMKQNESYAPVLTVGSFATKGARQTMEDTLFLRSNVGDDAGVHAFGVFDGHRGMASVVIFVCRALDPKWRFLSINESGSTLLRRKQNEE